MCLGVAQLVARNVWDVEVAGSSPVTQTIFVSGIQGLAQLVARSVRDAEVVGSSPITLTIFCCSDNWGVLCKLKNPLAYARGDFLEFFEQNFLDCS